MKPYSEMDYRMVGGVKTRVTIWRVDLAPKPNRRRKTFATKAKAEMWILANAALKRTHGEVDFLRYQALSAEDRRDVLTAREKLTNSLTPAARKKVTLTSCVECFLKFHSPGDEEMTVIDAMEPYILEKQKTVSADWGDILAITTSTSEISAPVLRYFANWYSSKRASAAPKPFFRALGMGRP